MTKDEALKLALEALESLYNDSELMVTHRQHKGMKNAITAIREALAQPEQGPVSWENLLGAIARGWTHPETEHKTMDVPLAIAIAKEVQALYTTPPQRKPLTDEEIAKLADDFLDYQIEDYQISGVFNFARAIEAAHGIKE